jgi:hypothetical protein
MNKQINQKSMRSHKEHVISNEFCLIKSCLSVLLGGIPETDYPDFRKVLDKAKSNNL